MTKVPNRTVPAYKVLSDELRAAITDDEYPPGYRLPTEHELAAQHGLSRQTVRQAFNDLVAQSLVYRIRGRGTFAIPPTNPTSYLRSFGSIDELLALSIDTQLELVAPFERRADVEAASRMRLGSDEVVVGTFRRLHEGVVFCVTTTYLPPELGRVVLKDRALEKAGGRTPVTIIGLIDRYAENPVLGAHQSITAVAAEPEIAEHLECAPDAPVLRIDRIYYDRTGAFVELAVSHFDPARYSYRVELRRDSRSARAD
jgi:DNA-binding GntR family transcriptional regulator